MEKTNHKKNFLQEKLIKAYLQKQAQQKKQFESDLELLKQLEYTPETYHKEIIKDVTPNKTPPKKTDTTVFKLCVWYSHKLDGTPYSYLEKQDNKNRKYHDSYDFVLSSDGWVTRNDLALNKLLNYLEQNKAKILNALLFCNDKMQKKQYLIGKFSQNETFNLFIMPKFTEPYKNAVFYDGLTAQPIETYELVNYSLSKNARK